MAEGLSRKSKRSSSVSQLAAAQKATLRLLLPGLDAECRHRRISSLTASALRPFLLATSSTATSKPWMERQSRAPDCSTASAKASPQSAARKPSSIRPQSLHSRAKPRASMSWWAPQWAPKISRKASRSAKGRDRRRGVEAVLERGELPPLAVVVGRVWDLWAHRLSCRKSSCRAGIWKDPPRLCVAPSSMSPGRSSSERGRGRGRSWHPRAL
mmetsp:Transcript_66700/g.195742  ORF Transcript_66700/g.195742 Transcript_66700/m.195742 type:complete len:213 (+) Transcript_66700:250-888(+)